ncbi:hypothetical protein H8959_017281 [Pygathrix nigripes]
MQLPVYKKYRGQKFVLNYLMSLQSQNPGWGEFCRPNKVAESAVEKHFLDCGSVMAVRIVRDQVTGVGKGFGYVLFEENAPVQCHIACSSLTRLFLCP